jgi:indole-3-glycerol phosphate synthase
MKSPAKGKIETDQRTAAEIALMYQKAGVSAISVLTDQDYFGGSFADLKQVSDVARIPILCKDIIIDEKQIILARQAGAHACLLIAAALEPDEFSALKNIIESYGMTAVIEIHTEKELNQILSLKPQVLLINNRNLQNLNIDLERSIELARKIPPNIKIISASGFSQAHISRVVLKNI